MSSEGQKANVFNLGILWALIGSVFSPRSSQLPPTDPESGNQSTHLGVLDRATSRGVVFLWPAQTHSANRGSEMFLETWGILHSGFLASLPLTWRAQERFLPSGPESSSAEGCPQFGGARGQVVLLPSLEPHGEAVEMAGGPLWNKLRPPLSDTAHGVKKTANFGNAEVPHNHQKMLSTQLSPPA